MKIRSFNEEVVFDDKNIKTKVLLESSFTKEIRIVLKKGQFMKEHKTPFPIVVHVLKGEIDFGISETVYHLKEGELLTLEGSIPHDLKAKEDSIVRLTLSKSDKVERVENVIKTSSK
ncbi:cupin [Flavobacteriaceae bacterium R38]|nr:cupin [Flavobacteriaceae bacterium R38]